MTDLEALSHLLDGDLPAADAEAFRQRIESEPALAATWAAMQALPGELMDLDEPAPPRLDQAILRPPQTPAVRRSWTPWVAAAAALVLLAVWSKPTPTRVLISGQELVTGTTLVLAGDTEVRVQGRALISVEPPARFVREEERTQEIASMNRTHLAAALAGAFVTVAVYEGSAAVTPAGAETIAVAAGETRSFGTPAAPTRVEVRHPVSATTTTELTELQALREDKRVLEAQLAASRIGAQFADARIEGHEGIPQPWPEDIPAAWQPEPFAAAMEAAMEAAGIGDFPLEVDCSEFPCLAMIEASAMEDRPDDLWDRIVAGMSEPLGGDLRTGIHSSNIGSKDGPTRSFGVLSFWPGDRPAEGAKERMGYRADAMVEDAMGDEPEPDRGLVR